jgi:hypothetical protein
MTDGADASEGFFVEVRLRAECELRFRLPANAATSGPVHVALFGGGTAEWCAAPLASGVRYLVPVLHARVAVFSWTGCVLRVHCRDAATFASMEPYVATGVAWHSCVAELHAHLRDMRQRAMQAATATDGLAAGGVLTAAAAAAAAVGPTIVIGGGAASGRHALATSLANMCTRSGGGCCTLVDLDPLHQTVGPAPLTIGAAAWEHTRVIDDSSTPHFVTFCLAAGVPFGGPDGATLGSAYSGAALRLVKTVRQRVEANVTNRVGWSGAVIVLPRIEDEAAYAALAFRVCETARATRIVLLGANTRGVMAQLHSQFMGSAGAGAVFAAQSGAHSYTRQMRGVATTVDVMCAAGCPSSLVVSDGLRAWLHEAQVRQMLVGTPTALLQQVRRAVPLAMVEIATLCAPGDGTADVAARVTPEAFKADGELRIVAVYASLHDCTSFTPPLGLAVVESVDMARREVVLRVGRTTLPEKLDPASNGGTSIALVSIPGCVVRL